MNTPNKITISIIILVPFMMFFYLSSFIPYGIGKFIAFALFIIAAVTDRIDGHLARKNKQVTDLGKLLDPIADKMLITCGFLLIIVDSTIAQPWGIICFTILFARDTLVNMLRQIGATKGYVFAATISGKLKAIFQYIHIPTFILIAGLNSLNLTGDISNIILTILNVIGYVMLGIATIITFWSAIDYTVKNLKLFEQNSKVVNETPTNNKNIIEENK